MVVATFVMYWAVNIFFNLPTNPLKAKYFKYSAVFDFVFYQRWEFFAPPPDYNEFLYYNFINKKDNTILSYEVCNSLSKEKAANAPFNGRESILEYILSGNLSGITKRMIDENRMKRYKDFTETDTLSIVDHQSNVDSIIKGTVYYDNLSRYGSIVSSAMSIDKSTYPRFYFVYTQQKIPKFFQRNISKNKIIEDVMFISDTLYIE